MVEHDPYEALFGYSNRLLRGMRGDRAMDYERWWQKEMSFRVRNPFADQKEDLGETLNKLNADQSAKAKTAPAPEVRYEAVEYEYDPVTNRKVLKVTRSPHAEPIATLQPSSTTEVKRDDEAVDIPVRPYRPTQGTSTSRAPPSFTMLKEDLPQTQSPKQEPVPTSPTRAEYEQYKARRLAEAERTSQFLETEGFRDSKPTSSPGGRRGDLESRFDDLHSRDQQLADEKIVEKKPWSAQRSHGTTISAGSTFAAWRQEAKIPAYDETRADREIHEYTMQVAGQNLRNKQAIDAAKAAGIKEQPYKPLVHPSGDVQAEKDIRDYATRVASDNLKTRRLAEFQKARQDTDERLAEMRRKQFEEFNKETRRMNEERANMNEARKELRTVKATLLDAKARLAQHEKHLMEAQSAGLQTSLERHQNRSAVTASRPLKTSLQRLNNSTSDVVAKPAHSLSTETEQTRTHDPVGYNHGRESSKLQQINATRKPYKVPSLAEVFGYNKADRSSGKSVGQQEIDPSANWLLGEIESQKAAFSKHESDRKESSAASTLPPKDATTREPPASRHRALKELEQKKQDAALVREIRQIYEEKYGPITTSHTQPAEDTVSATVEVAAPSEAPAKDPKPITETARAETEPASTLSTPTPMRLAKYTILAYDPKSKNMTTASFESTPSETENAIQATVALRHLAYANRFLPKLIELQHRGFVPVHAERNLLILRQDAAKMGSAVERGFENSEEDPVQSERYVELNDNETSSAKEPKRLEQVFSGTSERHRERAWQKWKEQQKQERARKRRRFGRAVRWSAGGVMLSGAVVYLAGVGAEVRQNRGRGKVVVTSDGVTRS